MNRRLVRGLGLWAAIALVVGHMIGTGVFLKAAPMAQAVGSAGLVMAAWVAAGLLTMAGAFIYAELGSMLPKAGGGYVFLREAYGGFVAFLMGWSNTIVSEPASIGAFGAAFAAFAGAIVPLGSPWFSQPVHLLGQTYQWQLGPGQILSLAIIAVFGIVNSFAVRIGGGVQIALTALKVAGIAALVVGAFALSRGTLANLSSHGLAALSPLAGFGAAMLAALWAYDGWQGITMTGGEVQKPERTIPLALIVGVLAVMVVYVVTNAAYFFALPFGAVAASSSTAHPGAVPVATKAAMMFVGSYGASALSVLFILSLAGALNASILANARITYAMAADGLFFSPFAKLTARGRVPANAVWINCGIACVLVLLGTFDQLTNIVIFVGLIFLACAAAAIFVLRRKLPNAPRPHKAFGYPIVPIIYIACALWLVVNTLVTSPIESLAGLIVIAVGIPFYIAFKKKRAAGA